MACVTTSSGVFSDQIQLSVAVRYPLPLFIAMVTPGPLTCWTAWAPAMTVEWLSLACLPALTALPLTWHFDMSAKPAEQAWLKVSTPRNETSPCVVALHCTTHHYHAGPA